MTDFPQRTDNGRFVHTSRYKWPFDKPELSAEPMPQGWHITRTYLLVSLTDRLVYRMRQLGFDDGKLIIFDNTLPAQVRTREFRNSARCITWWENTKFLPPKNTIISHEHCFRHGYFSPVLPVLTFRLDENNVLDGGMECGGFPDKMLEFNSHSPFVSVLSVEGNNVELGWRVRT